jgi:hypothetical protein
MRPFPLAIALPFGLLGLLGLLVSAPVLAAPAAGLIEGSDPRAEPFKKAVATLAKELSSGSLEKAQSAYVGEGADLELLKAYVDGVAAAKAMRAAIDAKFGADPKRRIDALDTAVARMSVMDSNSVIFYEDPDAASTSADSPLGVGIEFKKVKGEWKVRSLASAPNTPEEHTARLKTYAQSVAAITERINAGKYREVADALGAAGEAASKLWP